MSTPNRPNPPSQKAHNRAIKASLTYTNKLRSVTQMLNDNNILRIRTRLSSDGTPSEIVEEGYCFCRLNASLRRDLDEAHAQLRSPMSLDDDTTRIKTKLDAGASAADIAGEGYRLGRINAQLRKELKDMDGAKKKYTVVQDALQEIRDEVLELRKVLKRAWGLLGKSEVKVPKDLRMAYNALVVRSGHDWCSKKGLKKDVRLSRKEPEDDVAEHDDEDGGAESSATEPGDGIAPDAMDTDTTVAADSDTFAANKFVAGVKRKSNAPLDAASKKTKTRANEEEGELDHPAPPADTTPVPEAAGHSPNLVVEQKRKNTSEATGIVIVIKKPETNPIDDEDGESAVQHTRVVEPGDKLTITALEDGNIFMSSTKNVTIKAPALKNIKYNQQSEAPNFWKSHINLSAAECRDESVAMSAPPFPFKQSWDPAIKMMHKREKKQSKGQDDVDLEEGEIRE